MTVLPLNVMPFWRRQLRVPQGSTLVLLADIFINHKSYRVQLEPRNQLFFVTFHFLPVSAGTCGASFSQYTTNTGCPKSHFTLPFYCFVSVIIWTDMKRSAFASLNLKVLVSISFPCQLTLEQRCKKFLYL